MGLARKGRCPARSRRMPSPFESGSLASIFATPVWIFKPARGMAIGERLAAYLKELRDADPRGRAGGSAGVWQSRDDLHRTEDLAELVSIIGDAWRAALSLLQVECTLKITGLWGNISRGQTALHEHTHPNNYLSGVFYARMPEGQARSRSKIRAHRPGSCDPGPCATIR